MIADRISTRITDDSFVVRYFYYDQEVLTLASDYRNNNFVLHNCPFTVLELFDIIIPRHICGILDEVNVGISERVLNLRLGGKENLFELDFTYFNFKVFGLEGVKDFIFNEEALEKLKNQ